MIEANAPTTGQVVKQERPAKITTSQIIEDLENGINREGIKEKYNLESWMVSQLFQHPELKGKKAKKVRKLPFEIIDDTSGVNPNQTSIPTEEAYLSGAHPATEGMTKDQIVDTFEDFEEENEFNNNQ